MCIIWIRQSNLANNYHFTNDKIVVHRWWQYYSGHFIVLDTDRYLEMPGSEPLLFFILYALPFFLTRIKPFFCPLECFKNVWHLPQNQALCQGIIISQMKVWGCLSGAIEKIPLRVPLSNSSMTVNNAMWHGLCQASLKKIKFPTTDS